MTDPPPALVQHLERYLGRLDGGWSSDADGTDMPFTVVRFKGAPSPDSVVFSTIGLSDHKLVSRRSGKGIRHELIVMVSDRLEHGPVPGLLQQVGQEIIESRSPLLRGDIIGPRGPLFAMSHLEALYAAMPVYLPDEFSSCTREDGTDVVFVWLIPISRSEAQFARTRGWDAFEDRLADADADLTDVDRAPLL